MAKPLRPKRGTTAKNDAFTGLASEITIDTEKHSIRVHDGVTAGGHEILPKTKNDEFYEAKGVSVKSVNGVAPDSLGNVPFTIGESNPFGTYDGVDLNAFLDAGIYAVSGGKTALNFPIGVEGLLAVYVTNYSSDGGRYIRQVFYRIGTVDSNDHHVYTRTIDYVPNGESKFGQWNQVVTSKGGTLVESAKIGFTAYPNVAIGADAVSVFIGNNSTKGCLARFYDFDDEGNPGGFQLRVADETTKKYFVIKADGTLKFGDCDVEQVNETGTSGEHSYIRFESGLQIIWGAGLLASKADTTFTLPVPFVDGTYRVVVNRISGASTTSSYDLWLRGSPTATYFKVYAEASTSMQYVAIGKWK